MKLTEVLLNSRNLRAKGRWTGPLGHFEIGFIAFRSV